MRTVSMKENIHLHVYTIVLFVLLVGVRVWEKRSKTVSKRPLPRLLGLVFQNLNLTRAFTFSPKIPRQIGHYL